MNTEHKQEVIQLERKEHYAIVRLNRPLAMNALSRALRAAITETFVSLQNDDAVRAVILTGNGKAFCAGLDLKELAQEGIETLGGDDEELIRVVTQFDRPIIGAINGVAVTGGLELALMCDVLIASPEARFADTHARIGVIPKWRLSQLLQRMVGANRAREMHFTGNFVSAERAESWGLVNEVVPAEQLMERAEQLATDMASCDADTLRALKRLVNDGAMMTQEDALALEVKTHNDTAANASADKVSDRVASVKDRGRAQSV